jgi:DNA-binding PadR family transcriptional regulator
MEEKGLVSSKWSLASGQALDNARRRYYTLTKEGLHVLQERRRFRKRLDALSISPEIMVRRMALNRCLSLL